MEDARLAIQRGHTDLLHAVLHTIDVNQLSVAGDTLLHYACQVCDLRMVKELIARGADVNQADNAGRTPIMIVTQRAQKSTTAIILYLVEHGADINQCDPAVESILYRHIVDDQHYAIHDLRKAGLILPPRILMSVLISLANYERPEYEIVEACMPVISPVTVNYADRNGVTPLMRAARLGMCQLTTVLLEHGALYCKREERGLTALDIIQKSNDQNHKRCAAIIRAHHKACFVSLMCGAWRAWRGTRLMDANVGRVIRMYL